MKKLLLIIIVLLSCDNDYRRVNGLTLAINGGQEHDPKFNTNGRFAFMKSSSLQCTPSNVSKSALGGLFPSFAVLL